jgi:HK97 family phage portal protein
MNAFMQWLRPLAGGRGKTPTQAAAQAFDQPYGEQKGVHYPLIAFHGPGEANWSFAGEGALARRGFARNPVVYRCVRMIAEAAASLPVLLYEGEDEVTAHPLMDLLARPAGHMARQPFLETLYGHLLVSGDAYVHAVTLDDAPRELHLLRPDRVHAVTDEAGWPIAWEYTTGSTKVRIAAEGGPAPLLHVALFNPLDGIAGLPPLGPAHMALDIHNAASRWNKALLDNSARPSGALVYAAAEGANLSEEQFERLKGELEEGYSGATRAGRPMLLEGGLDWKAMGYSPRDMDFIEAKNGAARDIALAYGVPPMLLGIPGDNTYANFQEANRALWRQTVLPLAGRVTSALGGWLGGFFARGRTQMRLEIDRDNIEALAGDREALWRRLNEATFLTADEKRAAAGYPPLRAGSVAGDGGEGDPLSLKFDLTETSKNELS